MNPLVKSIFIGFLFLYCLISIQCNPASPEDMAISFEEIQMEGMDRVSVGGELNVVIRTQNEYNKLIYQRFQKPLDEYWNANYESVLQSVKEQHPGLSSQEYQKLVKQVFYSVLPFSGTENYKHPKINFNRYTLLGQEANSGGCKIPEYKIEVVKNGIEYTYRVTIKRNGSCDMGIPRNKWILIPKISSVIKVKFEKIEVN